MQKTKRVRERSEYSTSDEPEEEEAYPETSHVEEVNMEEKIRTLRQEYSQMKRSLKKCRMELISAIQEHSSKNREHRVEACMASFGRLDHKFANWFVWESEYYKYSKILDGVDIFRMNIPQEMQKRKLQDVGYGKYKTTRGNHIYVFTFTFKNEVVTLKFESFPREFAPYQTTSKEDTALTILACCMHHDRNRDENKCLVEFDPMTLDE